MRRRWIALLMGLVVLAAGAAVWLWYSGGQQAEALPPPAEEVDGQLSRANLDFSFRLLQGLMKEGGEEENLFVSPTSISMALSMTMQGAAEETHRQMAAVLGVSELEPGRLNRGYSDLKTILQNPDPDIQLSIANSLWAREGEPFLQEFLDTNREYYGAEVQHLDFSHPQASETINSWVEEETEGRITDLVDDQIDPQTIMFLINAIYFHGRWQSEFDPQLTGDDTFYLPDGEKVEVPFMHQRGEFRYLQEDGYKGVALPFGEGRVSMYMLLPEKEGGLPQLVGNLDVSSWRSLLDSFSPAEVQLAVPRFSVESDLSLKEVLRGLGMEHPFDPQLADFSRMHPAAPETAVWVEDVRHKSFLQLDEEGAEAAAATSVEVGIVSMPQTEKLTLDRPFLFAIYDDLTDTVLFAGWVMNPGGE